MSPYEVKEVLISINDVSLSFDGRAILRGVSAQVKDIVRPGVVTGQVVGILGPSGIGKTQLARIMSGLQEPTSGSVTIYDTPGKSIPVHAGLVGVVAQNYPLLRHRTVLGNLLVAASRHDVHSDPRARSLEMLERFGLLDKAQSYPSQLSGGQRQRVAILQQLLCSENFIIMDEPFTGLDPLMKDKTCELIAQVASLDERNTIFVVAHDIAAVAAISDHLWLIGRDLDDAGKPIPGAHIQVEYDLAAMDFAWHPEISGTPRFAAFCADVKEKFKTL
jgi:polar amino acid transport system ATP-binding protein/sulfate transport system ATP-binding protein